MFFHFLNFRSHYILTCSGKSLWIYSRHKAESAWYMCQVWFTFIVSKCRDNDMKIASFFFLIFVFKIQLFEIQPEFLARHLGCDVNFPSDNNFELVRIKMSTRSFCYTYSFMFYKQSKKHNFHDLSPQNDFLADKWKYAKPRTKLFNVISTT